MIKFGTGGWRDVIGENFNFDNVRMFSQGVASGMIASGKQQQGVVIGFDNRFMSEDYAKAAGEVFAANSIPVIFLTESVPTPLVNFVTKTKDLAGGLMFTASHNPYAYNGIKFVAENGYPANETVTAEMEEHINQLTMDDVVKIEFEVAIKEKLIERVDMTYEYVQFIKRSLDMDTLTCSNLKVLYDPMYGTGKTSTLHLLVTIQSKFNIINDYIDPLFGGRPPTPNEKTLWKLINMMKEESYDIGLATDGDADRLAVVDNMGDFVHPNEILSILYYYLLEYKKLKGTVVRNVSTTHLVDAIATYYGEDCLETPVGFKYIAEGLVDSNAIIGGESSGGITIRGHLLEKDSLLATGILLEMLAKTGKTLAAIRKEIVNKFGSYVFSEENLTYPEVEKNTLIDFLNNKYKPDHIADQFVEKIERKDGLKYLFRSGDWVSIRFSGTEPLLRLMAESSNKEKSLSLISGIKEVISQRIDEK